MKTILRFLFGFFLGQQALNADILDPGARVVSPDSKWEVWVEKEEEGDATFFISARGSTKRTPLAQNARHFGAEWAPDSKTLLVYDNLGSGQSDTIVFRHTPKGWKKIYRTPGGFHIHWRLEKWLPNAVRLRSSPGGSAASEVPATVLVPFDARKPRVAPVKR